VRVLATGAHGYIANHLKDCLDNCELASLRGGLPNLHGFDAVVHLAAIVHNSKADMDSCRAANRDLTFRLAMRAKEEGVSHFIFMSTMAVYGFSGRLRGPLEISPETRPNPKTPYAISKHAAEEAISPLASPSFSIAIIRPPMVYGENCPGNYSKLEKLVAVLPAFPKVDNERSMIEVHNLCLIIKDILENGQDSPCEICLPQDPQTFSASQLAKRMNPKIRLSRFLGFFAERLPFEPCAKMFGSLTYTPGISFFDGKLQGSLARPLRIHE
jgi:UDP-glucose 4-epimerase